MEGPPTAGFASTFPQTDVKDLWPAHPVPQPFLDQDYRYKSVAKQISHDSEMALVSPAEDQTRDR